MSNEGTEMDISKEDEEDYVVGEAEDDPSIKRFSQQKSKCKAHGGIGSKFSFAYFSFQLIHFPQFTYHNTHTYIYI